MKSQFARYLAAGTLSRGFQIVVMVALVELLHTHYVAANILSVGIPAVAVFFLHRYWTFRAPAADQEQGEHVVALRERHEVVDEQHQSGEAHCHLPGEEAAS